VYVGNSPYYRHGGRYYWPYYYNGEYIYEIGPAPIGLIVDALPEGCQTVVDGGVTYYLCGNDWYVDYYENNYAGYQVVSCV